MTQLSKSFILLVALTLINVIPGEAKELNPEEKVENLRTFSKLYGYIKHFHPSDEAAAMDWDRFAVYGVQEIQKVKSRRELKAKLKELFKPIAPTLKIYDTKEDVTFDIKDITPSDLKNYKSISWQHYGVQLSKAPYIYKSLRTNRNSGFSFKDYYCKIWQKIEGKHFQKLKGKTIRFKAAFKTNLNPDEGNVQLWYSIILNTPSKKNNKKTEKKLITNKIWKYQNVVIEIPENAVALEYGFSLNEKGKVFIDDCELQINESDRWITLKQPNHNFEISTPSKSPANWRIRNLSSMYNIQLTNKEHISGKKSLLIENSPLLTHNKIFPNHSKPGDLYTGEIGNQLTCTFPLALYGTEKHTFPQSDQKSLELIHKNITETVPESLNCEISSVRIANVIISWNILQHFYPYFDVVKTDWNELLSPTLKEVLNSQSAIDLYWILSKMVARLQDGHGYVFTRSLNLKKGGLPVKVELREGEIVIVDTRNQMFQKGDVIESIDGNSGIEILKNAEKFVSGSPWLRRHRALNRYGGGKLNTVAKIKLRRSGKSISFDYKRAKEKRGHFFVNMGEFEFPALKKYPDNIYYINLKKIDYMTYIELLPELVKARGVIFDSRYDGRRGKRKIRVQKTQDILAHLAPRELHSAYWNIPRTIIPDRKKTDFHQFRWKVQPVAPFFKCQVVFINDPAVVSYGETIMGIIEHYRLAKTVGEPTAGCNGNVIFIKLPGKFNIMWTGMKVLKHDGSQHHLVGIKPDYPVKKTIKAVLEGRDEFLEKALEVIRNSTK